MVAVPNDCIDPNALAPQTVRVTLLDGSRHSIELPAVLGHPQRLLPAADQRAKFNACCAHAGLSASTTARLHAACGALADADDITSWVSLMNESRPCAT